MTVANFGRTPVVVAKSVSSPIHLTDTITGIASGSDKVKIMQPGQACSGTIQTGGGATAISGSTSESKASFSLTVVSVDNVICYNDGGGYVDTLQRITVAGVFTISPIKVAKNVQVTLTLADASSTLSASAHRIKVLASGSELCNGGSDMSGGAAGTLVTSGSNAASGTRQVTLVSSAVTAKVCFSSDGAVTWSDTGTTVQVAAPTITSMTYNRQMKGDEVAFTVVGTGLSTTSQLIRVIESGDACNSHATGDILQDAGVANGAQKSMTSPNAATTSATVTFTLNARATGAKFCLLAPTTQLGTGGYADTGSGSVLTVTVLEVTAIVSSKEVTRQSAGAVKFVPNNLARTLTLATAA